MSQTIHEVLKRIAAELDVNSNDKDYCNGQNQ
ncbi:hypothetical protein Dsui_2583 [Azospira oryzae PS]|uniref:Uncharacterized protein n=1 Tax=Azospira oryzae (strain ATCC BAA-33 / DSM 13638 / PS) TaxID=640081 RepID=G8QNP0_AZOOP|nr:hypothetical protein Dsui_2583 [Azospira oryzae PS]